MQSYRLSVEFFEEHGFGSKIVLHYEFMAENDSEAHQVRLEMMSFEGRSFADLDAAADEGATDIDSSAFGFLFGNPKGNFGRVVRLAVIQTIWKENGDGE